MTAILCKSDALGKELASLSGSETSCLRRAGQDSPFDEWLRESLAGGTVTTVFYEPCFFIDPAPFRAISPKTRFVLLASQDNQHDARRALSCGASAILVKPFTEQDVRGVLSLVTD